MISASGVRIGWADLPAEVRRAVQAIIGGTVVEATSQAGGFSPGTADRIRTADGRRAFVKAVSPAQNDLSPAHHRREAAIGAVLPATVPAPRLIGCHDDGWWVALVFDDVDGRHPATPWAPDELARVLAALDRLSTAPVPEPLSRLLTPADRLVEYFGGWHRIAADPPSALDPWVQRQLPELCTLTDRAQAAMVGDRLVHTDIRADNLLLGPDGAVTVVDWPLACRGPAWLDAVLLLINVRLFGGHDTDALLADLAGATGADPDDLVAVLAAAAGYFVDVARLPAPSGLPTVRAFQRAQGDAVLAWLRERWPGGG